MPVALRAGVSTLSDWMLCRVGVGAGTCGKLVVLASCGLQLTGDRLLPSTY